MSLVPAVIHTIWLAADGSDSGPPRKYDGYNQTWRTLCPTYEHRLWRRSHIDALWQHPALQEFLQVYERMHLIEQCDYSRYALMLLFGGVYHDQNMSCLRNLDPLLARYRIGIAREPPEHFCNTRMGMQFLMSEPGHPFWLGLMRHIRTHYDGRACPDQKVPCAQQTTGPEMLLQYASANLPPNYWIPQCEIFPHAAPFQPSHACSVQDAYTTKHWHATAYWGLRG
jgi:mannosyltransferase OCH1-like enzyme